MKRTFFRTKQTKYKRKRKRTKCKRTKYTNAKLNKNVEKFLVKLFRFCFKKTTPNTKFLEFSLLLRDSLVGTLKETREPTSRKN